MFQALWAVVSVSQLHNSAVNTVKIVAISK